MSDVPAPLRRLVQLAFSAERAAAFAYQGHAASVRNADERQRILAIAAEEWQHRENLRRMLLAIASQPSRWFEFKYYCIGKLIAGSCFVIGYFMPMYFAGRLESGNVNEYLCMIELSRGTILEREHACMLAMARVEKEHEVYFLSRSSGHWLLPLFQRLFGWGPGASFNSLPIEA